MTAIRSKLTVLALAVALVACSTAPSTSTSASADAKTAAEAAVSERAVARWNALIARKPDVAYEYLSPGVRSALARDKFVADMSARPVNWISARVYDIACESDACKLTVELEYEVQVPAMGVGKVRAPAHLLEHWVRVKRDWYHVPEDQLQ
jgi:hypothetical protein